MTLVASAMVSLLLLSQAISISASFNPAGYHVFSERLSFAGAMTACINRGGQLATVHSVQINDMLYDLAMEAGVTDGFWLGAIRNTDNVRNRDSDFDWIRYSNTLQGAYKFGVGLPDSNNDGKNDLWLDGEPNNYRNREMCIRSGENGRWNDARCDGNGQERGYACYIEPTTTTKTAHPTTSTTVITSTTTVITTSTTVEPVTTTTIFTSSTTVEPTTTTTLVTSTTSEAPTSTTTVVTTSSTALPTTTTTLVTTTTPEPTTKLEPPDWSYFPESDCWYKQFGNNAFKKNAQQAAQYCATFQFHDGAAWLATPITDSEAMFVGLLGEPGRPAWNAGFRAAGLTEFVYPGGDLVPTTSWYSGEPNGDIRNPMCVQRGLSRAGADNMPWKFNDADCSGEIYWTCQYCHATTTTTPQPTTTTTEITTTTTEVTTTTTEISTTTTIVTTTTVGPTTLEVPDWEFYPETGCYYYQTDFKTTWDAALSYCTTPLSDGYHREGEEASYLAFPSTEAEAMFMASFQTSPGRPSWVALRKYSSTWSKLTSKNNFSNYVSDLWYAGEGENRDEPCAQMGYSNRRIDTHPWRLNDASCANLNFVICSWCPPEEPTTTSTVHPTTSTTSATTTSTAVTTTTTTTTGVEDDTIIILPSDGALNDTDTTRLPITSEVLDFTAAPVSSVPSLAPSLSSSQPTPAPSTSNPTPAPTFVEPTSTPTGVPTMSPSVLPTCAESFNGAGDLAIAEAELVAHFDYVAEVLANTSIRKSGRSEPYKTTCVDYCSQRAFGSGCQPCALETLVTEEECLFPGPFGSGVLCHKNATTLEVVDTKCCMRKSEELPYAAGNTLTTCRVPKRECDCDRGFDYSQAFAASQYMNPLPRVWTGTECVPAQ